MSSNTSTCKTIKLNEFVCNVARNNEGDLYFVSDGKKRYINTENKQYCQLTDSRNFIKVRVNIDLLQQFLEDPKQTELDYTVLKHQVQKTKKIEPNIYLVNGKYMLQYKKSVCGLPLNIQKSCKTLTQCKKIQQVIESQVQLLKESQKCLSLQEINMQEYNTVFKKVMKSLSVFQKKDLNKKIRKHARKSLSQGLDDVLAEEDEEEDQEATEGKNEEEDEYEDGYEDEDEDEEEEKENGNGKQDKDFKKHEEVEECYVEEQAKKNSDFDKVEKKNKLLPESY